MCLEGGYKLRSIININKMRLVNILNRKQLFIEGMCKLRRKFLDYGTNLPSCCVLSVIGLKSFKVDMIFFFWGGEE